MRCPVSRYAEEVRVGARHAAAETAASAARAGDRSAENVSTTTDSTIISTPVVYSRSEHTISRADISKAALKVLYTLRREGYEAYLVGGGVRDLLLGRKPKDFDVATSATPGEIRACFRNSRLIGRRFVIAHVRFGREIVEVATFRAAGGDLPEAQAADRVTVNGRVVRDNVFGTREEDAWRRDFSVNSLYYSIADFSVLDHTGGMADLREGCLRLIGDPEQRFREDPVRMLRAVRFAAKLGFEIDAQTSAAMPRTRERLLEVSSSRLYEEVVKLFLSGGARQGLLLLRRHGLFALLFPDLDASLEEAAEEEAGALPFIDQALANTDARIAEDKPVTPAFLFAALLWPALRREARAALDRGESEAQAIESAGEQVIARQVGRVSIPRRCSVVTREIWSMQARLLSSSGRRALGLMTRLSFRAAYDFLLLRNQAGEPLRERCEWWTRLIESDGEERELLLRPPAPRARRRRRRRRGERRAPAAAP